jgi:hypothetical protein
VAFVCDYQIKALLAKSSLIASSSMSDHHLDNAILLQEIHRHALDGAEIDDYFGRSG